MAAAQPASGSAEKQATDSLRRVSRALARAPEPSSSRFQALRLPSTTRMAISGSCVGVESRHLRLQIIDSDVYNLSRSVCASLLESDSSSFAAAHPGGEGVLLHDNIAGKDSTKAFFSLHRSAVSVAPSQEPTDRSGSTSTSACGSRASRRRSRA